jgi:hypothetical protein
MVNIVDPNALTGNEYRITFDDSTFENTVYHVQNVSTNQFVVQNATELDGTTEGPLFEGLRLIVKDFEEAEVDNSNTGWNIGSSDIEINIYLATIDLGGGNILYGYPYPADYTITLFDQIVDTSSNTWGALPVPIKFSLYNETENHYPDIIFLDNDNDNTISRLDELYIIETDSIGGPLLTWAFAFGGQPSVVNPVAGDEYAFKTLKPFTFEDVFEFSNVTSIDPFASNTPEGFKLYQNYPNPFNPITTIRYNLPKRAKVSIKIYDILGREVYTLLNRIQKSGLHSAIWDGRNKSGNFVSSGVYIYQIQTGAWSQSRKMLLMK